MNAMPRNAMRCRLLERGTVRRAARHIGRVPVLRWLQRTDHGCASTDVITVRMREHERVHRSPTATQIGDNRRPTGVAALPAATRIEQDPAPLRRSEAERVSL